MSDRTCPHNEKSTTIRSGPRLMYTFSGVDDKIPSLVDSNIICELPFKYVDPFKIIMGMSQVHMVWRQPDDICLNSSFIIFCQRQPVDTFP